MSETWEEAVLRIVRAKNGVISLQEIYEEIESHQLVTPHHKELWGGQPQLSSFGSLGFGPAQAPWSGPARWPRALRFKLMHYRVGGTFGLGPGGSRFLCGSKGFQASGGLHHF